MKKGRRIVFALALGISSLCGGGMAADAQMTAVPDGKFVNVEVQGVKFWLGGGDLDLRTNRDTKQLVFKLINKLETDHGFAIDALKIRQVVKPGEELTVTVAMSDIDTSASVVRFYCHLHPGHVGGTLVLMK